MAGPGKTWTKRVDVLLDRCVRSVWEALVTHGRLMAGEAVWSREAPYAGGLPLWSSLDAPGHGLPEWLLRADVSVAELEEMLRRE